MSRVTRSQSVSNDENAAPKENHFRFTKRGSGIGGGLVKVSGNSASIVSATKPLANITVVNGAAVNRKSIRPALGDISNRIQKTKDDQMPKKKRVVGEAENNGNLQPVEVNENGSEEEQQDDEQLQQERNINKDLVEDVDMKEDETQSLEDSVEALKLADVDAEDKNNPQAAPEYISDIMAHLFENEAKRTASPNYMLKQTDINAKMREILIDWLVEVHLKFKLRPETLYLTVNFIDRFLERRAVSRTKLQLVGCTAMLIASKYEEIYAPEVRDFVYISDQAYTRDQILAMESIMLNTLGFYLTLPTTLRFGERLCRVAKASPDCENLTRYFMELTLQDSKFLKYLPSEVGAAATFLALKMTGQTWDATMQHHAGYDEAKLRNVLTDLHQLAIKDPPKYRAVRKKYLAKKFCEVSKLPVPDPFAS